MSETTTKAHRTTETTTTSSGNALPPPLQAADAVGTHPSAGKPDIEHVYVIDDPRQWSRIRKHFTLFLVSSASMISGLAASIQNPAIEDMEQKLHATSSQFSLSIALFILIQGGAPLFWSSVTEIKGRKIVYVVSISIFCAGSILVATSRTMGMVIGFRCLQAAGSSAILAIGAATLADIFEPAERGTKMGLYYISLSLASSLAPIFGGVLTQLFHWQGPFWFLAIFSGLSVLNFIFLFKDTFRRERSVTYQNVVKQRRKEREMTLSHNSSRTVITELDHPPTGQPLTPGVEHDLEKGEGAALKQEQVALEDIKLTLKDVNPFKPLWKVLRRLNNITTVFGSGLLFSFNFVVVYTSSRTLGTAYHYSPLKIGFVLVSFGVGSIIGGLLGGKYSDHVLSTYKAKDGGNCQPEMRLWSTIPGMILLPPSIIAYGWVSDQRVNIAAMCVMLFLSGFFLIWIYSSTLAYIVDANLGRSSTSVALNSSFRGFSAFVATEIAVPLQDAVGDGVMYTIWGGLIIVAQLMLLLVIYKGGEWRESAERSEAEGDSTTEKQHGKSTQKTADNTLPSSRILTPALELEKQLTAAAVPTNSA